MRETRISMLSTYVRRAAIITSGIVTFSSVYAKSSSDVIVIPPTALPALARQSGDAMFLRDARDGRSILYVEQNNGTQLAVFDVTDPSHVKAEGPVALITQGPYDFVAPLGNDKELIRFQQSRGEALLDLHKPTLPSLMQVPGLQVQGEIASLGIDEFTASEQAAPSQPSTKQARDYDIFETFNSTGPATTIEVAHVRDEVVKKDTGTSFVLAQDGLYVIRRPGQESDKRARDQERFWRYNGG